MKSDIEINVDERGRGTILIDGVDFSNKISAVELISTAGEVTKVKLTFHLAAVKMIGSALVEYQQLVVNERENDDNSTETN